MKVMVGRTVIVKMVDKSKCHHCGNPDVIYFEEENLFWCPHCKRAYQYEEHEREE